MISPLRDVPKSAPPWPLTLHREPRPDVTPNGDSAEGEALGTNERGWKILLADTTVLRERDGRKFHVQHINGRWLAWEGNGTCGVTFERPTLAQVLDLLGVVDRWEPYIAPLRDVGSATPTRPLARP